eukprot:CAMPEP_0194083662 /NCGR_PEP_ID=MMETSP0149-20130528/9685_1 /TAXON_ID=122233 /ORGANISM="Chaetoceros debilis, Strain MM31A-1" /LENGTH=810 /DNA_ID=CAMNT_0038766105 /DNA_START=106 /DNA_END=2538 /DNA_ORIENTATION=-
MDGGQALTHRQMPAAEESAEISSDTPKGRILPSSTADVKAAIAAIQARSAALRKHNTELTSSMNDGRINVSRRRQPVESRQTFSGSDSDDSDDDDDDDDIENDKHLMNVGSVIDKLHGGRSEAVKLAPPGEDDVRINPTTSSLSSDYFSSDDDSFAGEGMVSTATQMNIAAFIDSLNSPKPNASTDQKIEPKNLDHLEVHQQSTIDTTVDIMPKSKVDIYAVGTIDSCVGVEEISQLHNYNVLDSSNLSQEESNSSTLSQEENKAVPKLQKIPLPPSQNQKRPPISTTATNVNIAPQIKVGVYDVVSAKGTIDSCVGIAEKSKVEKYADFNPNSPSEDSPKEDLPTEVKPEIVQEKNYKDDDVMNYVEKVKVLAQEEVPKASRLEYIIFYARREGIPLIPLLDAFDESRGGKASTDATRLVHHIRAAVMLIEAKGVTFKTKSHLLNEADSESVDISLLKQILSNPKKHVKFVGFEIQTESIEEDGGDWTISKSKSKSISMSMSKSKTVSPDVGPVYDSTSVVAGSLVSGSFDPTSFDPIHSSVDIDSTVKPVVNTNAIYLKRKREQLHDALRRVQADPLLMKRRDIDAVDATKRIFTRKMFKRHPSIVPFKTHHWKVSKSERSDLHDGYKGVDHRSLLDIAVQIDSKYIPEHFDWEKLGSELVDFVGFVDTHEQWFGSIDQAKLNRRFQYPAAESNMISMNRLVYPKIWEEEWYTSWLARKQNPGRLTTMSGGSRYSVVGSNRRTSSEESSIQSSTMNNFGPNNDSDKSIGKIYSMRYRSGERLTKVHWDYSSFLFKSRWKKKYYPKGIF